MTMKPAPSGWVWPSMVTLRSCIACNSAAWVFGGVRLISSASSSSVKIGPRVRANWLVWKLNRLVPSTSPGIRSGVNWMRPNFSDSAVAKLRASSVLATPGTPSSRICPWDNRPISRRSMAPSWPTTTLRTSPFSRSAMPRIRSRSIQHLLFPTIEFLRRHQQQARLVGATAGLDLEVPPDAAESLANAPRLADAVQPGGQRRFIGLQRRMDAPAHIIKHGLAVARGDRRLVAAEAQHIG